MQQFIYIANWKAYLSYDAIRNWLTTHEHDLSALAGNNQLIICPPASALTTVQNALTGTSIALGAQDVAAQAHGALTGQEIARSLQEIGCTYCIIGHSERRTFQCETDDLIGKKTIELLKNNITPIICIGESKQEHTAQQTGTVLNAQLTAIMSLVPDNATLLIAYEPIWAIGTGATASAADIESALGQIRNTMHSYPTIEYGLLYGGSVTPESAGGLKTINGLDGFLIGGASTKYTELEKIIDS